MHSPMKLPGLLVLLLMLSQAGCAPNHPSGTVSILAQSAEPVMLETSFGYGCYSVEEADTELILSTVPLKDLQSGNFKQAQVIHAQLLWVPRAGYTPVNNDATNLVIRHVVLVDEEVGIYGGGGFAWPKGTPGKTGLGLDITGSNLALLESTKGFRDLLSPAVLKGWIAGPLDSETFIRYRNTISQIVTDRVGRTLWVDAGDQLPETSASARDEIVTAASLTGSGHSPG